MYILRVKDHFDAAHFLPWHEGKCKNLHGHRWEVEVIIQEEELTRDGIVIDFGIIKGILEEVMPDHLPLNMSEYFFSLFSEFPAFKSQLTTMANTLGNWCRNPTAENIAKRLYEEIDVKLPYIPTYMAVKVWESPNCSATYTPVRNKK